jgi:hypothetical protein
MTGETFRAHEGKFTARRLYLHEDGRIILKRGLKLIYLKYTNL